MIDSLTYYWNQTDWLSFWGFWFPVLLTLVLLWVITFALSKVIPRVNSRGQMEHLTTFHVHRAFIWSACVVASGWVAFSCWSWSSHYYDKAHLEFTHLLCIIIALTAAVIGYISLRKYYSGDNLKAIKPIARTYGEANKHATDARKGFGRLKLSTILPWLGFIALLGLLSLGRNLIVIFLDNSSSMEAGLTRGQQALSQTFRELPPNTEVVLASFPQSITAVPVNTIDKVLIKKKANGVMAFQEFASPQNAEGYLRGITIGDGSPITEAIWDLFLVLKTGKDQAMYDNRKLLVVTDGGDNIVFNTTGKFLCSSPEFEEFFSSSDIHIISINTNAGRFFDDAANCGYDIQDGNSLDSYASAVEEAFGSITTNWDFIWIIAILLGIFSIVVLLISPAQFN